jgi:nucleoside-diphosphate-sugar epimerase
MKALVTGATGFIGSHLVEALLKRCYKVKCLARQTSDLKWIENLQTPPEVCESVGTPSLEIVYGDCLDKESLASAVTDCDYIFHLAGLTKTMKDDEFFTVNTGGTENIVKAVLENNSSIKRFVFLSSLSAIGPCIEGRPVDEKTEPHPASNYGRSKLEAEKIVLSASDRIPVTVIRPPAVYGPRDRDFYILFKLIKRGLFPSWGISYYSLVYIDDLVNGIILSAESSIASGKIYFISDMEEHTNEEIASEIAGILKKRLKKITIPKAVLPLFAKITGRINGYGIINGDKLLELFQDCWVCDSSLATRDLQYKPKVPLREGLRWTADWYRINRWL